MAKAAKKAIKRVEAGTHSFQIVHPAPNERICIRESDGTIHIVFNGDPYGSYSAATSIFVVGSGNAPNVSSGNLIENPVGSGSFSLDLSVGTVSANPAVGTNNRLIQVSDLNSGYGEIQPFAAIHCGSGSLGIETGSLRHCSHCDPQRPVPVALILEVGNLEAGTCEKCDRIGEPTLLIHANDIRFPCSWFSRPIDFCSGDDPAGIWMLEKADARTWKLILRRKEHIVVHYELTTKTEKDCSFPLKLRRSGTGGNECKKWPMTVRIEPAP
jgi:hypothetical protein